MVIRSAEESDLAAITAIYNGIIRDSTAIYRDHPVSLDDRRAWWQDRRTHGLPVFIAEAEGAFLGYASYGDFRFGEGYRFTVEGTVHLHPEARGKGIGSLLLQHLIAHAKDAGKHRLIAGVDSENEASLRFLERAGFVRAGRLNQVGFKFGRYLDLVFLQYPLQ